MSLAPSPTRAAPVLDPRTIGRKVAWRIIPLIFLLYIISYLDRANASFAKLPMQQLLGFSDEVFGWGFGIFFVGYLLLEIPGALIVEHWSARLWFARILFTWGICSMGMALVRTPGQFYFARFMLGLAEAGFFPGVIVYFSHWFPRAVRTRALSGMILGIPISMALGAIVSEYLLTVTWFGLEGWQWLFIVEGLPAVVMGIAVPFLLTDRPADATWLTPDERDWLQQTLDDERAEAARNGGQTLRDALRQPAVWLLALSILAVNTGGYALIFWLPTAVKNFLLETGRDASHASVLGWLVPIFLCGLVGVLVSGYSSDRTGQHKWHCVVGMAGPGIFLLASVLPGQSWSWVFAWLCLCGFFLWFWPSPFWVLPTLTLSSSAAAVSIGFINMCANAAGIWGSPIVGTMKQRGLSDESCLVFLAIAYLIGAVIIAFLRVPTLGRSNPATVKERY